ncbi:uncharacterized protein [Primulina huaijiensis]|uniref:uncharacterized protein n=1 Tax=Primulina huaijiensis TaxID=1492673 RepID=UPI003CC786E2
MASMAPSKSQPLHDFNPASFKWSEDGNSSGHPQRRRSVKSPLRRRDPSSLSPLRQSPLREVVTAPSQHLKSPLRDSVSPSLLESQDNLRKQSPIRARTSCKQSPERERMKHSPMGSDAVKKSPVQGDSVKQFPKREFSSESETLERNKGGLIEYRRNRSRNSACESVKYGIFSSSSEHTVQKSEKRQKVTDVDAAGIKKSKFLIKIHRKSKSEEGMILEVPRKIDANDKGDETDGVKEEMKTDTHIKEENKMRTLRPRKPLSKCLNVNSAGAKISTSVMSDKNKHQSPLRSEANRSMEIEGNNNGGGGGGEKKVKKKLSVSIALSKTEIEVDIFSMTGSKPRRKPKKRAKNIQKQVDYVFPGMWLISITPDSYKVSENCLKG